MTSIVVTGAAGVLGRRVVTGLLRSPEIMEAGTRIVALDRALLWPHHVIGDGDDSGSGNGSSPVDGDVGDRLVIHRVELTSADLEPLLSDAVSVVHLADGRSSPGAASTMDALDAVLGAAAECGVGHMVVLSSAMVYGAHRDNPIPIPESHPLRPEPTLDYAVTKAELELRARSWARRTGAGLAVLRPATSFSEAGSTWIGLALRAALALRPDQVDPPVQFVHDQDLADAVILAVVKQLDSTYNVAADGWIGADDFRALRGESEVRLPEQIGRLRLRAAKSLGDESLLAGLEPYVRHPWVVATDKLKAEGWRAAYSNEESYVAGTPPPLLATIGPKRRQELALGVASAAGAAVIGGALWTVRRLSRRR